MYIQTYDRKEVAEMIQSLQSQTMTVCGAVFLGAASAALRG